MFFRTEGTRWKILSGMVLILGIVFLCLWERGGEGLSLDSHAVVRRSADGNMNVPETEEPALPVPADRESSPDSPVQALNGNNQTETATLAIQLVWKDTGAGVSTASLTLTPMTDAEATSTSQALVASTDTDGKALLSFPTRYPWLRIDARVTSAVPPTFTFETGDRLFSLYTDPGQGEPLRLEVQRLYELSGTVYASGAGQAQPIPVPGAEVSLSWKTFSWEEHDIEYWFENQDLETTTTVADASGYYVFHRVPSNFFHLSARSDKLVTGGRDVVLKSNEPAVPFDLTLEPGFSITLLVNDKKTLRPIPDAKIQAQYEGGVLRVAAQTNADGFADLPSLPTGSVSLKVSADGYLMEESKTDITGTQNDITLFPLAKGGTARIRTVDSHNTPIPNAQIRLNWESAPEELTLRTDERGEVRLTEFPLNTVIEISGENRSPGGRSRFFLLEGQEKDVTFVVMKEVFPRSFNRISFFPCQPGWVTGRILDPSNRPVAGATIESFLGPKTLTDSNGAFRLENLRFEKVSREERERSDNTLQREDQLYVPRELSIRAKGYLPTRVYCQFGTDRQVILCPSDGKKGQVLDKETNQPIRLFDLVYQEHHRDEEEDPVRRIRKRCLSETGGFALPDQAQNIKVLADGYTPEEIHDSNDESENRNLQVSMKRGESLKGRVVDEKTGEPLRDVLVGYSKGFTEKGFMEASLFDETRLNAEYVEVTNVEGEFDFKRVFGGKGGLAFFRADLEEQRVPLELAERYQNRNTGKLVIPMNPVPPCGSLVLEWFDDGVPAPCPGEERTGSSGEFREESPISLSRILYGDFQSVRHTIGLSGPGFSYSNGVFRWDNLKPGEYMLRLPRFSGKGQEEPVYLTHVFTLASQEVKTVRWGNGHASSLSGRIVNAQDEPYPQIRVRLTTRDPNRSSRSIQETFSTPDGTYRLDCLLPGKYGIVIAEPSSEEGQEEKVIFSNEIVQVDGATQRDIRIGSQ